MFENDKGKGFLLCKRNAQHFSARQLQSESLACAKITHVLLTCFSKHVHSRLVGYGINLVRYFI
jgi:hypothetical protein